MRGILFDATLPDRVHRVPYCATRGKWCSRFWLAAPCLCIRETANQAQARVVPCPDVRWTEETVRTTLERIRRTKLGTLLLVVINGVVETPRSAWRILTQRSRALATPVFDQAGEQGRCTDCAWTCLDCEHAEQRYGDRKLSPCRINGYCCLAEEHVVGCVPLAIQWSVRDAADVDGSAIRRFRQRRVHDPDTPEPGALRRARRLGLV